MKILQWNARSIIKKKHELENIINQKHYNIIIIVETWLKEHKFKIKHYDSIWNDRADGKGGVCIFIDKSINITAQQKYTDL